MADYVSLYTYQNDVSVSFAVEDPKIMALGEKLEALCPDAYMNGYNWDVLFRYYLEEYDPDVLEGLDPDPEAGSCVFHWPLSPENEARARRFEEIIRSLIEREETLCRLVEENGGEIEWD